MRLIKLSLVVMGFCFLNGSYAMHNDQDSIGKVVNARDSLVKALTIMESRNRVMQMPIFQSVEAIKNYELRERMVAMNLTHQAHNSLSSILNDAHASLENKRVAGSLLKETVEIQAKISNNPNLLFF